MHPFMDEAGPERPAAAAIGSNAFDRIPIRGRHPVRPRDIGGKAIR